MTATRSFAVSMGPVCRFGPLLKSHWQRNLVWHYPSAFVVCSPLFVAVVVVDDLRCGCVNFCWQVGNGIGPRWNCGLRERCVASNGCLVIAGVFVAAVDYSCLGNLRRGGSACILRYGEQKRMLQGGTARTTNNRMEVTGSDRRTACADQACEVEAVADSGYLRRGVTEFPQRWRSNGWKAASGNPVLNQDLWWELAELAGYHRVTWIHVGGHSGHADQERCDALAFESARQS